MPKLREMITDSVNIEKEQQRSQDKAMILITMAIYLLTAGTLIEYVSVPTLLKVIGFMMTGHAFYFLWKSSNLPGS